MNKIFVEQLINKIDKFASSINDEIYLLPKSKLNDKQKKYLEKLINLADKTEELKSVKLTAPNFEKRKIAIMQSDKVVGFLTPIKEWGFWNTDSIFIDPELQGQGIGKKAIMQFFHHTNHKPGKVWIANFNKASQKAFQACGFVKEEMYNRSENPNEQGYLYVLY